MNNTKEIKDRYTISCTNVPDELFDKVNAKEYFKQFGRVLRIVFRQKSSSCLVDYDNKDAALEAVKNGRFYKNTQFNIELLKNIVSKTIVNKSTTLLKKDVKDPDWPEDPELKAELDALSEVVPHQHVFRTREPIKECESVNSTILPVPVRKTPVNKMREKNKIITKKTPVVKEKIKKKIVKSENKNTPIKKIAIDPVQVAELLDTIKKCAYTAEDKYRILDARDKLIRIYSSRQLETSQTQKIIGTCPDMCPEKERFLRESKHQVSIYEQDVDDQEGYRMNHRIAIKQYSRSSADQEMPLPHELRPVAVLQLTMSYLLHQIMNMCDSPDVNIADWYHFVWDRTRSIRKDITQQQLCCHGSVQLVEQCARFHIHCAGRLIGEDVSVFDPKINTENLTKCLQTLKYMYHDLAIQKIFCKNESEFRGYIILLNLHDSNFMWEVKQLRGEIQKSEQVQFAIKVFLALDNNNFVSFFKLVRSTTYLNACILLRYFNEVRFRCISRMIRTHSPRTLLTQIPLQELEHLLAFEDRASTISFLKYYGLELNDTCTHVILDKQSFSYTTLPYELDRAIHLVESKKCATVGQVICGDTTLPDKLFETHIPQYSFDERGFLKKFVVNEQWFDQVKSSEKSIDTTATSSSAFVKSAVIEPKVSSGSDLDRHSNLKSNIFNKFNEVAGASVSAFASSATSLGGSILEKNQIAKFSEKPKTDTNIFSKSIFQKPIITNIFEKSSDYTNKSIFKQNNDSSAGTTNIMNPTPFTNLYSPKSQSSQLGQDSIDFSTNKTLFPTNLFTKSSTTNANIFGSLSATGTAVATAAAAAVPLLKSEKSIFANKLATNSQNTFKFADENKNKSIFSTVKIIDDKVVNLDEKYAKDITTTTTTTTTTKSLEMDSQMQKEKENRRQQEQIKKQQELQQELERVKHQQQLELELKKQHELELQLKKQRELELELKKQRELELALELKKQQELEQLRKQQQQMEELLRKQQELERIRIQKELEQIQKDELERKERVATIKILINDIIVEIENRHRRLQQIADNIKLWKIKEIIKKWQAKTYKTRKRKAIEDTPVWMSKRTHFETANQLYTTNQKQALDFMKQFKFTNLQNITNYNLINHIHMNLTNKINFKLSIYEHLKKSLYEQNCLTNTIFWKVQLSVPDQFECNYHSTKFLHILSKIFVLNKKSDSIYLDSIDVNNSDTLNICLEISTSDQFDPSKASENVDFIFFGINTRETIANLKMRIDFYLKRSFEQNIIIILRRGATPESRPDIIKKLQLDVLIDKKHIKNYYLIFEDDYSNRNFVNTIEVGFCLLAKTFRLEPPLHMNLLENFLHCGVGYEFSQHLKLKSRENITLRLALKNVNAVINIYNEAIDRLKQIVINEQNFKYPKFPCELKEFLKPLLTYPCTYQYFPSYWQTKQFMEYLNKCFDLIKLSEFNEKWPATNIHDMEYTLKQYCDQICNKKQDVDELFLKILTLILDYIEHEEYDNFLEQMNNLPWIDILQIFILYNIDRVLQIETDMNYEKIVIYDKNDFKSYQTFAWFLQSNIIYENKCSITADIHTINEKSILDSMKNRRSTSENICASDDDDNDYRIDENQIMIATQINVTTQTQQEFSNVKILLDDLDSAIKLQKQAVAKFSEIAIQNGAYI